VLSATSVGSSADSKRPPEEAHAEQRRKAMSGNAGEARRIRRIEELGNLKAGGRNDIVVR
jgi:hypothetical protein